MFLRKSVCVWLRKQKATCIFLPLSALWILSWQKYSCGFLMLFCTCEELKYEFVRHRLVFPLKRKKIMYFSFSICFQLLPVQLSECIFYKIKSTITLWSWDQNKEQCCLFLFKGILDCKHFANFAQLFRRVAFFSSFKCISIQLNSEWKPCIEIV